MESMNIDSNRVHVKEFIEKYLKVECWKFVEYPYLPGGIKAIDKQGISMVIFWDIEHQKVRFI
jgi:hypothetical protein